MSLILLIITALSTVAQGQERVLRYGVTGLPPGLGNPYSANGPPSSTTWSALFDGLTRIGSGGTVTPALATSWRNVTPTIWRFHLREGVSFSNGEVFDAAAVVATFDYLKSELAMGSVVANELSSVVDVREVNSHTVDIESREPDAILPNRMVSVMIVAPEAWAEGIEPFALMPVGTGPFVLEGWGEASGRTLFNARSDSWRWEGPPTLDRIEFYTLSDVTARVQALLSGQIDMAVIGPDDVAMVRSSGLKVYTQPAPQVMSLALITFEREGMPLSDKRVRQALNYAVDKQGIAEFILQGLGTPAGQGAGLGTFGYNPSVKPYAYDPAKAKELLQQAGYTDGFSMSADVVVGSAPGDALIYQIVKQNLAAVNVDLTLRPTVFADWFRKYLNGTFNGDAFGLSWNATPYNDAMRPMEYFSCAKTKPFFCDLDMMQELSAAARELDSDKREVLLQSLQERFHDLAPAIFLVQQSDLLAYDSRFSSIKLINRIVVYEEIRMTE